MFDCTLPVGDLLPICAHAQNVLQQDGAVVEAERRARELVLDDLEHVLDDETRVQVPRATYRNNFHAIFYFSKQGEMHSMERHYQR